MNRTGGQLIVEALQTHGADRLFCVPGESYLAVLDALHDSPIGVTVCRQEGGAAMMADAHGRLTGRPGICFVTRGPGATNAAAGLHIARQDSAPMILFIGQVQRAAREREAFQEIEYRRMMTELAKWVGEIDCAERIPEFVARAFATATSGRLGPVVLALPEDVLRDSADVPPQRPYTPVKTRPGRADMAALEGALAAAQRPIAILGGSGWSEKAVGQMADFAERFALPVACSFRRQMLFDHLHGNYAGDVGLGINPKLAARIKGADLVLLVGGRFGETPSGNYSLLAAPNPAQSLVHVHADAAELGRVYRPDVAINASPAAFAEELATLAPPNDPAWAGEAEIAHGDYLAWSEPTGTNPGAVQMGEIMRWLRDTLPEDAILTNGAGNYAAWQHRYYRFRRFGTQLAPASGSMGYGVPAAVAAKQLFPDRPVVAFSGDGCFMMNGQEFATAVQYRLPIIVLLVNNGIYGTIRMHQEMRHPGRAIATDLVNPDFAALARAYGGHGETVRETADFAPAFERAAQSGKPAIIDIHLDPEAITTTKSLSELRGKAG
ncbi:MAG: thiamine pyrophosphate-binding protein [Hyphomicrobiales bacterium]|nr:thiamine pyrophosphate-binding protein [Hyphomicrobiales bacterium]